MGIKEVEALNLARRIALFNSEVIFYLKNSLMMMTPLLQKQLAVNHEKFTILIKSGYNVEPSLILANYENKDNHDLTKIDPELIRDMLVEGYKDESGD